MLLNNQIPGLPEWPPIAQYADDYVVGGPHVSYRRYMVSDFAVLFLIVVYVLLALIITDILGTTSDEVALFIVLLAPLLIFLAFFPASILICQWFFPRRTLVRFTPRHIIVDKQTFERSPNVPVQFRASRMHLSQEHYNKFMEHRKNGKFSKSMEYQIKFRKIEMIYGSKIVHITSLADEDRAAQFAVALQHGYELAGQHKTNASRNPVINPTLAQDSLPE